ncbi:hypothetical protein LCGC14_2328680, partial [marine sediment metagenome]
MHQDPGGRVRVTGRKLVLFLAKATIAALLLAWVLSQVHWRDYVIEAGSDGAGYSLVAGSSGARTYRVSRGMLWWKSELTLSADQIEPIPGTGRLVRPGMASSLRGVRYPLLATAVAHLLEFADST